jgi:hypothetical protein
VPVRGHFGQTFHATDTLRFTALIGAARLKWLGLMGLCTLLDLRAYWGDFARTAFVNTSGKHGWFERWTD